MTHIPFPGITPEEAVAQIPDGRAPSHSAGPSMRGSVKMIPGGLEARVLPDSDFFKARVLSGSSGLQAFVKLGPMQRAKALSATAPIEPGTTFITNRKYWSGTQSA